MLVMTLGDKPPLRANSIFLCRRNNQIANTLSFPMVSFPIGYDPEGLPICAQFKGPRFSEPAMVQAMIDYQARFPEHHQAVPADPAPVPLRDQLTQAEVERLETVDPFSTEDPLVHEANFR